MPELPEVETVVRGLSRLIIGKSIKSVSCDNAKSLQASRSTIDSFVIGSSIVAVRRRGKGIIVELSSGYAMLGHLKMTGQMVYVAADARFGAGHPNDSLVEDLPNSTTRITIDLDDASRLYFNDVRKFGWIKVMPIHELETDSFLSKLGPEALSLDFGVDDFTKRMLRYPNRNIKALILDQSILAGVGNIYADESIWMTSVHPTRVVSSLSKTELGELYTNMRSVMNISIDLGGSTNKNYVNAEGKRGNYLNFANVYARVGQPCKRCMTAIVKIRVAGRGTHICPICQVLV
jgi:formamidopyrimidine-DNA glycosylase